MKYYLLLINIFLFNLNNAQDLTSLKTEATKMYENAVNLEFDKIFDQTYPKVFEIASREQMKDIMSDAFTNDDMSIQIIKIDPRFTFGEIKKINNQNFCLYEHENKMSMKFKEDMTDSAQMMINMIKESMKASEVTYDSKAFTFTIQKRSKVLAVWDDTTNNTWKFLNIDNEDSFMKTIFKEDILKQLGIN